MSVREPGVLPAKILFNLNRGTVWGREWFWELQQRYFDSQDGTRISRNNAMASHQLLWNIISPALTICCRSILSLWMLFLLSLRRWGDRFPRETRSAEHNRSLCAERR